MNEQKRKNRIISLTFRLIYIIIYGVVVLMLTLYFVISLYLSMLSDKLIMHVFNAGIREKNTYLWILLTVAVILQILDNLISNHIR